MNGDTNDNFKGKVFAKIKEGHISMRPKIEFTLRVVALILLVVLVVIVSTLLFGYILLMLRISGRTPLLDLGFQGFLLFLRLFPWLLLALDAILVIGLELLLRKFSFGYRSPVLYLLLGTFAFVIAAGFIIDRETGLDNLLLHRADENALPPPLVSIYENARHDMEPESGVCECVVTSVNGDVVTAYSEDHPTDTVTVVLPPGNPITDELRAGDTIFVAGNISSGTLTAFGAVPWDGSSPQ